MPSQRPISVDALRRLDGLGPKHIPQILRAAERGDWRVRAWGLSAVSRLAAREHLPRRLAGTAASRLLGSRDFLPTSGLGARYVRGPLTNALVDRSWPVRVAAALAIGECGSRAFIGPLTPLLKAPFRAERVAAAAAIRRCGGTSSPPLLSEAAPAPRLIGDHTASIDFLTDMAAAHAAVLAAWNDQTGVEHPPEPSASAWAQFLAGQPTENTSRGLAAEVERYQEEGATEYLLTKPFSHINRRQNIHLLHTFMVLADQLRLPPGACVLDMGSGSAWVSELLSRFGFQPITMDLSSALLAIGSRRFARTGLAPRFLAGDMTHLPLAAGSVDAVVVSDALHHVPDVNAVFHEVFRVLSDGGLFLVAEPGEGHSETPKSLAEMLEFGVQEREIHVDDAIGYGRAAGFDPITLVPHHAPGLTVTPAQFESAIWSSADDWIVERDGAPTHFAPYLTQAMFDHPLLVFQKGRRPLDSLAPGRLQSEIASHLTRDRQHVRGTVTARNAGDTIWRPGTATGSVTLGIQLLGADHRLINRDFERVALLHPVAPGKTAEFSVEVTVPSAESAFVLKLDLVSEKICWFEDAGSRVVYVSL